MKQGWHVTSGSEKSFLKAVRENHSRAWEALGRLSETSVRRPQKARAAHAAASPPQSVQRGLSEGQRGMWKQEGLDGIQKYLKSFVNNCFFFFVNNCVNLKGKKEFYLT